MHVYFLSSTTKLLFKITPKNQITHNWLICHIVIKLLLKYNNTDLNFAKYSVIVFIVLVGGS